MIKELQKILDSMLESRSQLNWSIHQLQYQIDELDRKDLRERKVQRFCRLTKDWDGQVEYANGNVPTHFRAGTLIQCNIRQGYVYLDESGDGNIYFPTSILEEVEIPYDQPIDWNNVISQG